MHALPLLASDASAALPFWVIGLWVLVLAIFVGFELISKVPPTLHTPLMSGSNAISGITLVGALYCASSDYPLLAQVLGVAAIALATVNVIGGFLVTDRMLRMFSSKKKPSGGS
jgi:H+-translocating NAD(P) transhydrogenase subunit alpha